MKFCSSDDFLLLKKINKITDVKIAEALKYIFYRNIERKNYILKKNSTTDFLETIGIISLKKIPKDVLTDITYNANELKGICFDKITKKI